MTHPSSSLLLRGGTIVRASGEEKADVLIEDGVIKNITVAGRIEEGRSKIKNTDVIDARGLLIFPGLIDCHVHFREPGLTHKATMKTEAAAAVAGGVTTVCEMPNTIPPTVTIAALADKVRRASDIKSCDIRFFFGVTEEAHLLTLRELWTGTSAELRRLKARCCGVKLYLDHSTGDQKVEGSIVEEVFRTCAELGITLVAHCEDSDMNAQAAATKGEPGLARVAAHSLMRPPESEAKAIKYAIGLAKKFRTHFHVAHLSTKQGIDLVRQAKSEGLPVTCEVAPHHLFLTVDDYATLGTFAKMNPPLRTHEHQQALWKGIEDGTVDCISTDHAPHMIGEKKSGDPLKAPSGVPGVETMVPLLLSVAAGKLMNGTLSYKDIVRLCFENPNRIFGLGKCGIGEGVPADIVLVDPQAEWAIETKKMHSKCGWTPYEGWKVTGQVKQVL